MVTFSMPGRLPGAVLSSAPAAERTASRRRLHLASLPLSLLPYLFPSLPRSPLPLLSSSPPAPRWRGGGESPARQGGGAGPGIHLHRPPPRSIRPAEPSGSSAPAGRDPRDRPGAEGALLARRERDTGPRGDNRTGGETASRSAGGGAGQDAQPVARWAPACHAAAFCQFSSGSSGILL